MYAFFKKYEYWIVALIVALPYLFAYNIWDHGYRDTDCYIHAWRAYELFQTHHWSEQILMKSNYPFGEVIHYTRFMDVLWIILALPLMLLYPVKEAIFNAGILFQPFIAVLTACALVWALRPYFNVFLRLFGVVLFFCLPIISQIYVFSRPDHHTIVACLTCLIMGWLLRYVKNPDLKLIKYAGIASGIMLWTSIEGLLVSYAFLAAMFILWIFANHRLDQARTFVKYYFLTSCVCLLVNPPYESLFHADNGRISVLTEAIIGLTWLSIEACRKLESKGRLKNWLYRGGALGILAVASAGAVIAVFGFRTVFGNPFTPEIEAWSSSVAELMSGGKNLGLFLTFAVHPTAALALMIFFFTPKNKEYFLFTACPLLFFTVLIYTSGIRFSQHSSVFVVFAVLYCLNSLGARLFKNHAPAQNNALWCGWAYLICAAVSAVILNAEQNQTMHGMRSSFSYLSKPYIPYLSKKQGSILTRVFDGSEIIWTTERPVIATPNHRNIDGIVDTYDIFFSNDMNKVKNLLKKRQVATIMIPANIFNLNPLKPPRNDDFAVRLVTGKGLPCGVELERNLPVHMQETYVIYHVDMSLCPP